MHKNQYVFVIVLFFILVYLLPLGVRPLLVPDETRYAEIPREMVASGEWMVPHLNGLKYYEKPVMGYWVYGLAQLAFGESNFAVRLPNALATGMVAFLMYCLVTAVTGRQDSRVYIPPLIFLSSFGVFGIGTATVLDNILHLFLTASVVLFFLASEKESRSTSEKILLVLAGIAVGCAFMTKGFLAFVVPVVTVVPYILWQMRGRELIRLLAIPAMAAVAVSLPWSIMIHLRDPDFWNFFFWHEHVKRFFSDGAQHHEPFYFYFLVIIPLFLPWIFLLPSACVGLFSDTNRGHGLSKVIVLCVCWLVFPFLFFSISNGKLVTYILPCFPPLSILVGIGLYRTLKVSRRLLGMGIAIFMVLAIAGLLAIIGVQVLSFNIFSIPEGIWSYNADSLRYSETFWKPVIVSSAFLFMAFSCFLALKCKNAEKKLVFVALSPLVFMISTFVALPDLTLTVKAPGPLLLEEAKNIPSDAIVVTGSEVVAAACWYFKRNDLYIIPWGGELHYALSKPEGKHRYLDYGAIRKLIESDGDKMVVLILGRRKWEKNRDKLPDPREVTTSGQYGFAVVKY